MCCYAFYYKNQNYGITVTCTSWDIGIVCWPLSLHPGFSFVIEPPYFHSVIWLDRVYFSLLKTPSISCCLLQPVVLWHLAALFFRSACWLYLCDLLIAVWLGSKLSFVLYAPSSNPTSDTYWRHLISRTVISLFIASLYYLNYVTH